MVHHSVGSMRKLAALGLGGQCEHEELGHNVYEKQRSVSTNALRASPIHLILDSYHGETPS